MTEEELFYQQEHQRWLEEQEFDSQYEAYYEAMVRLEEINEHPLFYWKETCKAKPSGKEV